MSTSLIVPPQLFYGDARDQQHASDLQQFHQRNTLPQVLRWDIASLSANGDIQLIRVPIIPGVVVDARLTSWAAGSGAFTVDIQYMDGGGVSHSVFAAVGDRLAATAGSTLTKSMPATVYILADPADTDGAYRFWPTIYSFAGTAWTGVTIELILYPISRS